MEFEVRFYPTTCRLPSWAPKVTIPRALRTLRVGEPTVTTVSPVFSESAGLSRSPFRPELPPILDPRKHIDRILEGISIDGVEIVEWMLDAFVNHVMLSAREIEYNLAGSQMVTKTGDPYIPGVRIEDCYIRSQLGRTVENQGYSTVITPRGNFNVDNFGKARGIFRDLLTWASNTRLWNVQFIDNLIKWKELVSTPITNAIGFFMDTRGNNAPNFFLQRPRRPALSSTVTLQLSSENPQNIVMNFRDPTNYTGVSGTKSFDIAAGTSQIQFTLSAIPFVPPVVAEIQPEDGIATKLVSYETTP